MVHALNRDLFRTLEIIEMQSKFGDMAIHQFLKPDQMRRCHPLSVGKIQAVVCADSWPSSSRRHFSYSLVLITKISLKWGSEKKFSTTSDEKQSYYYLLVYTRTTGRPYGLRWNGRESLNWKLYFLLWKIWTSTATVFSRIFDSFCSINFWYLTN